VIEYFTLHRLMVIRQVVKEYYAIYSSRVSTFGVVYLKVPVEEEYKITCSVVQGILYSVSFKTSHLTVSL